MDSAVDIVTVAEWMKLRDKDILHYDGRGKFMRCGEFATTAPFDDVFGDIPSDVTHIAWRNRWRNAHPTSAPPMPNFKSPAE